MSIWEWLFERNNPGPVGDIRNSGRVPGKLNIWFTIITGGLALAALCFVSWHFVIADNFKYSFWDYLLRPLSLSIYLIVCANYTVSPAYNNMGYLGFINNPFRYTDNLNRWLFFIMIALLPGKLIIVPLIRLSRLLHGRLKGSKLYERVQNH